MSLQARRRRSARSNQIERQFQPRYESELSQYTAPPPGFPQPGPPALNPQARPYQPSHLTWQQQQQQQQYRNARPPRRRQPSANTQNSQSSDPVRLQPRKQGRPGQNNARRANGFSTIEKQSGHQKDTKPVVDLPGTRAAGGSAETSEKKPVYPSCAICFEDCKVSVAQLGLHSIE